MTTRIRKVHEIKKVESLFQAKASLDDVESGGMNESGSWTVPTKELLRVLMGRLPVPVLYVFGVPGRIRTP
jgi:hypothetical protein